MPRNVKPLSAAQIHSVYASEGALKHRAPDTEAVRYARTSAYVREPAHSGNSSLRPDPLGKKKKY